MNFAERYNKTKLFDNDTENFEYKSPTEMVKNYGIDHVHVVRAIYINNSDIYGVSVTFATETEYVNVGGHMVDTAKTIINDVEAVNLINAKKVGFKFRPYENKYGKFYGVEFVNI